MSSFASRRPALSLTLLSLAAASLAFHYRQNVAGQIGGPISLPKLLWLDYALVAWFVVPFFFWRSPLLAPALRSIFGWHLSSFALRSLLELWMLYVTVSWLPAYGIAHDLLDIGVISVLAWRSRAALLRASRPSEQAARHFLTSIRVGLACEIVFAALFQQVRAGRMDLYFASDAPLFATINALTTAVVIGVYPDLGYVLWKGRAALFARLPLEPAAGMRHAEG